MLCNATGEGVFVSGYFSILKTNGTTLFASRVGVEDQISLKNML